MARPQLHTLHHHPPSSVITPLHQPTQLLTLSTQLNSTQLNSTHSPLLSLRVGHGDGDGGGGGGGDVVVSGEGGHERGQDGVRGPAGGAGAVPAVRAGGGEGAGAGLLRGAPAGAREEPQVPVRARQGQGRPQPRHQDQRHPRPRPPLRLRRHPRQRLPLPPAPSHSSELERRRHLQPRRRQGLLCCSSEGQLDDDDRLARCAGGQRGQPLVGGDRRRRADGVAGRLLPPAPAGILSSVVLLDHCLHHLVRPLQLSIETKNTGLDGVRSISGRLYWTMPDEKLRLGKCDASVHML